MNDPGGHVPRELLSLVLGDPRDMEIAELKRENAELRWVLALPEDAQGTCLLRALEVLDSQLLEAAGRLEEAILAMREALVPTSEGDDGH